MYRTTLRLCYLASFVATGWLLAQGLSPAYSQWLSVVLVVVAITYMSLVFGELAPKQIGLLRAERIAAAVAPVIRTLID